MANHVIIIGGQRSGSTSLFNTLALHTEICCARPSKPEPKYFLKNDVSLAEYEKLYFSHADKKCRFMLEKSTSYYEFPAVSEKIFSVDPTTKLLVILRNPVTRAVSNFYFSKKHGLETRTLKETFVDQIPAPSRPDHISVDPFDYLGRGDYAKHLTPYLEVFKENLKPIVLESMTDKKLQEIQNFIGVKNEPLTWQHDNVLSQHNQEIDSLVNQKLFEHFAEKNSILARKLNLDLSHWNQIEL